MSRSENISPTAYATGAMWHRYGLSHPGLITQKGRFFDAAFSGMAAGLRVASGVSFDDLMLARHLGIDAQLQAAIESGQVSQVIELAAGLSPRGWRFSQRYGKALRYIETDLPHMVREKRRLLQKAGLHLPNHQLCKLNVLAEQGEDSLDGVVQQLDTTQGLAIISEGLMNYLNPDQARFVWRSVAQQLKPFSAGQYLADFYLSSENSGFLMGAFAGVLQSFVRGRLHIHFTSAAEAQQAFSEFGFQRFNLHNAADISATAHLAASKGAARVKTLEAWV
ncbi:MAG: class I SAM-dependent methyltransferase [Oceanococcus sp.]